MSSRFTSLRGRTRLLGHGLPQDRSTLDAEVFEGSVIYENDGNMYYSDGTTWRLFSGQANNTVQGTQGTQGVQGLQGDYGPGFTIIGSVPDVDAGGDPQATLNTAFPSATVGDGVIDDADEELWIYDGTNWINIGGFRGVQGVQGTQGVQGVQGQIGQEGIQGRRGFRGQQGVQGVQGIQGVQGWQGVQGLQGVQGVQGVQGIQGVQGWQGVQGVQGPQGVQGTQGIQGNQGLQGYDGADSGLVLQYNLLNDIAEADPNTGGLIFNGASANTDNFTAVTKIWIDDTDNYGVDAQGLYQAMDGATSANKGYLKITKRDEPSAYVIFSVQELTENAGYWELDVTHISGTALKQDFTELTTPPNTYTSYPLIVAFSISGDQGVQGPQAFQGVQGVQGVQGLQGNIGFQGIQGVQGVQGVQGWQGVQGTQGFQGIQGVQGVQGVQGWQGVQGVQGVQGPQGPQGVQGTQGWQGTQGVQGVQGVQGNVGAIGPQGVSGQGIQGVQGVQGWQGVQGLQGVQGQLGYTGGLSYEWDFNSSTTEGFPGLNSWLLNNADVTQADKLYIDDLTESGRRVDELFNYLDNTTSNPKGQIFIRTPKDNTGGYQFLIFEYTDWVWGVTGTGSDWGHFVVNLIEQSELEGTDISPGTSWDSVTSTYGDTAVFTFNIAGQQGSQGAQGVQGVQGWQGTQGMQGIQGVQGVQGTQGFQGVAGSYGGASFEYDFDPDTAGTVPDPGEIELNSTDVTAATIIRVSETDAYGNDLENVLTALNVGSASTKAYIKITAIGAPQEFIVYEMTGQGSTATSKNLFVNYLSKSVNMDATYLTNNPDIIITFSRHGDIGPQGITGNTGIQGVQGVQGVQGNIGFTGPQGIAGNNGIQGVQGVQGLTGGFGGVTFDYTFDSSTSIADPGIGKVRLNNGAVASATIMALDERDDAFNNLRSFLLTIDDSTSAIKGHVRIIDAANPSNYAMYTVDGIVDDTQVGWLAIDISHLNSSTASFTNNLDVRLTFARTGDKGDVGPQGIQGNTGPIGPQGNSGLSIQGIQGVQGYEGNVGPQGIEGGEGTDGPQGVQGVQGFRGNTGAQGVQGRAGNDGITPASSPQGIQGVQGVQGLQGNVGPIGPQGITGNTGLSVQGVQGVQGNDGPIGPQGADGVNASQGIQGVQGIQGNVGVQGIQGNSGPPGIDALGLQGLQGVQGVQGFRGNTGPQGIEGGTGLAIQGVQGVQGFEGNGGGQGVQGVQGWQGVQGVQGQSGPIGAGTGGPQGIQGVQGNTGPRGEEGPTTQGVQGVQGIQGNTGPAGPFTEGGQGVQGVQGWRGFTGNTGGLGPVGPQGPQGVQGVQGNAGPTGPQGFTGSDGTTSAVEISNIYASALQSTNMFVPFVEGGVGDRVVYSTAGPNPRSNQNFFYHSNDDELHVENLDIAGNLVVAGGISGAGADFLSASQNDTKTGGDLTINDGLMLQFGTGNDFQFRFDGANNTFITNGIAGASKWEIRYGEASPPTFEFNLDTGDFTATGDIITDSDERLKTNIETIADGLEKVLKIRGVTFERKDQPGRRRAGVIAQEVEKVLPEVVTEKDDGMKAVSYGNMTSVLIEAIKELKKEVDDLKE